MLTWRKEEAKRLTHRCSTTQILDKGDESGQLPLGRGGNYDILDLLRRGVAGVLYAPTTSFWRVS
jgi:hypothetical protein